MTTQTLDYTGELHRTAAQASSPVSPTARQISRAWWAVVARFLIHGLVISTWVSRIPAVKSSLRLDDGLFGLTLLGTAAGSIAGITACGWAVTRYGSRRACVWTSLGLCLSLVLPAIAGNAVSLFAALFVFGVMAGSNDVAMNSHAVAIERLGNGPTMSRFHAMFSLGGIIGAGVGGLIAAREIPVVAHFAVAAALVASFSLFTKPLLLETGLPDQATHTSLSWRSFPLALFILSIIGFCIFLSEGAIADWTAIYLKQVLNAGPGLAAAGYAVFSLAMAISRLCGDAVTLNIGAAWTIRGGGILAACGLTWALLAPSPHLALFGFALVGAGFSSIIPLVFAAGGRVKGVSEGSGVAAVSGIGYLGFLVGPPVIGFISQLTSLRAGLAFVVLLSALAAMLVRTAQAKGADLS